MRILLIEDDPELGRGIVAGLSQSGYAVDIAATGRQARALAGRGTHSMAVLDLGLPDGDGIDLLQEFRSAGLSFPILILSARDALNDRIRGLDAGADDYLVKPFALGELEARLRALSRRGEEPPASLQVGSLRFESATRQAFVRGAPLDLTAREVALLEALLSRPQRIVSKEELFDAIFPTETEAAPNALEVHVSRLRQKLRRAGVHIRSVRGLGYRVERVKDAGAQP